MTKWLFGGVVAAALAVGSAAPATAGGNFSLSIGGYGPAYGYAYAPPVYYAPPPVYAAPTVVVPHRGHYDVYPAYGGYYGGHGHFHGHHHHHGHWGGRHGGWGGHHGHGHHHH